MGLSKKTFLYSITIAALMVTFVIGYFVLMLPSLYVDYVMKSNLKSVAEVQRGYVEKRTYDGIVVKNPTAAYSLEIPNEGSRLYVAGNFFKAAIEVQDEELQALLDRIRSKMSSIGSMEMTAGSSVDNMEISEEVFEDLEWEDGEALWQKVKENFAFPEDYPISVQVEAKEGQSGFHEEYEKFHRIEDNFFVYEAGISDENYSYTTYIAFTRTKDALIVTVLPTLTPQMDEITPVVMGSLPMIVVVIFLLILIASHFFSGKIVNPIIRLANYAESAKLAEHFETEAFEGEGEDEIAALGRTLQELYEKLRDNYLELEQKNRALEEENVRQEVFLRASSHQLKTPISAALLLVEGMIGEVGKYQNTKEYLPQVKSQLLFMKKIVEDILYLNYHADHMEKEAASLELLAQELVGAYAVQIEDKNLKVSIKGTGIVQTDREMLKKIMDNLLSNAVWYTPEGERIEIEISQKEFAIKNSGVTIDEELLPNIFEPFVSSVGERKGKGLGLYVASYYSRLLGYRLVIENLEEGVHARMILGE